MVKVSVRGKILKQAPSFQTENNEMDLLMLPNFILSLQSCNKWEDKGKISFIKESNLTSPHNKYHFSLLYSK